MSQTQHETQPETSTTTRKPSTKRFLKRRPLYVLFILLLAAAIVVGWQLLNNSVNSNDPTVAGRPLSNPHTHLHTIAFGGRPGTLYLGTHFGMFKSADGGKSWPQPRGALNTMMITSIAISQSNPDLLAVIAIPVSGVGVQPGVYFSSDGGNTWNASAPSGLSLSAYPYTIKAGSASSGHFYAFYNYAGWYETRDMCKHWYSITSGALSNMQTPSLLTDPANPDHLWLGGDSGLYETHDDGKHWNRIATVKGSVLYALSGQDLWQSSDSGASWQHRSHFDRGDLIALVVDPSQPQHLYAGFFLPAEVLSSTDGGHTWQTLTS